jgi:hypothetical protein
MEHETSLALTLRYTCSRIVTGAQNACDIPLLMIHTSAMVPIPADTPPICSLLGAGAMTTWAIKDSSGQALPGFLGSSRIEVGCKVMPARYHAFRLHVSASYRELFDRALQQVLQRNGWEIVQPKSGSSNDCVMLEVALCQGDGGGQAPSSGSPCG